MSTTNDQAPAVQAPAVQATQPPAKQVTPGKQSILAKIAERYSVEPLKLAETLKQTAFRQKNGDVTDSQMMALLIVADQYHLNPFTKEIYAFPDKGAIVPIVSVDGWNRIMQDHPQFDGLEFVYPDESEWVAPDLHGKVCPPYIDAVVKRKDRANPIIIREYLDECYKAPFTTQDGKVVSGPWQTHTKRMLRHKAMIQAARTAFGFGGIYDEDEGMRIVEAQVVESKPAVRMPKPKATEQIAQAAA